MSPSRLTFDPAAVCQRPLVRRGYFAAVTGLAVFLLTIVLLREPFHGYLAEVRMEGPTAGGLDLDNARNWLKAADRQVVVVPVASAGPRPHAALRMTYLAPQAHEATGRLDDLAGRWLAQYLPDRLQTERRARLREARQIVATARQREDDARLAVDRLRQEQLADLLDRRATRFEAGERASTGDDRVVRDVEASQLQHRIDGLRADLADLLARCTEQHPEVIRLRMQIAALQQQLRHDPSHNAASRAAAGPSHFLAAAAVGGVVRSRDWMAETERALRELSIASHDRQAAEHRASEMMQELGSLPTAADWTTRPAWVVTRIGGTPRTATLALAGLLASITAAGMFAAAGCIATPKIETTQELAAALEIPVIGGVAAMSGTAARVRRLCTPRRLMAVVRGAEGIVILAVAACLLTIAVEPALARQVIADPFGTLSEVIGRFG